MPLSFEINSARSRISNEQSRNRVFRRNTLRHGAGDFGLSVKPLRDIADLSIGKLKGRHAFLRSAVVNDWSDEVSVHVVTDEGRANQVRATGAARIRSMTESAGLLKLRFTRTDASRIGLLRADVVRVLSQQQRRQEDND